MLFSPLLHTGVQEQHGIYRPQDGSLVTGMNRFINTVLRTSCNLYDRVMVTGITFATRCLLALQHGGEIVTGITITRRYLLALQDGGEMVTGIDVTTARRFLLALQDGGEIVY